MKWSYSDWEIFDQCPRKYYHLKVVKDFKRDQSSEVLLYGRELHTAAENYVKNDAPLEPRFEFIRHGLDVLKAIQGTKHCEYKLGLTKELEPCQFFSRNVWWRGVADLFVAKDRTGFLIDYKTGKNSRYASKDQLELLTLALFKHHPEVEEIKGGLLFVISKDMIKDKYLKKDEPDLWAKWIGKIQRLESAFDTGVWNPVQNFSCAQWCPVESCEYYGKRPAYK